MHMTRFIRVLILVSLLALISCSNLSEERKEECKNINQAAKADTCKSERHCPEEELRCGEKCGARFRVLRDERRCEYCFCHSDAKFSTSSSVEESCEGDCPEGFHLSAGCVCESVERNPICPDQICAGECPEGYGFEYDEEGCNTCRCTPRGEKGACVDALCEKNCPDGYAYFSDVDGCRTCVCEPIPMD